MKSTALKAIFPFLALTLSFASCAIRQEVLCGNARFGYDLSPAHPRVEHPIMDSRGAVTLVAVLPDGTAVFQFPESDRRIKIRPGKSYFNPKVCELTLTVDSSDPLTGNVTLAEQLVP
jgi:hypothetical protein